MTENTQCNEWRQIPNKPHTIERSTCCSLHYLTTHKANNKSKTRNKMKLNCLVAANQHEFACLKLFVLIFEIKQHKNELQRKNYMNQALTLHFIGSFDLKWTHIGCDRVHNVDDKWRTNQRCRRRLGRGALHDGH